MCMIGLKKFLNDLVIISANNFFIPPISKHYSTFNITLLEMLHNRYITRFQVETLELLHVTLLRTLMTQYSEDYLNNFSQIMYSTGFFLWPLLF